MNQTEQYKQLFQLQKKPIKNRKRIKILKHSIQASEEGQRQDVLTPSVTGLTSQSDNIDKNNYATYSKQVNDINEMYNNRTDYGGEFLRAVLDTRVAFMIGEGLVIKTENEKLAEWINEFLEFNKLRGTKLFDNILVGEMEGKDLMVIFPDDKEQQIRVRNYLYYITPYDVIMEDKDNQKIKKIVYQKNKENTGTEFSKPDKSIYIKLGGSPDRINRTVPTIANVMTDIENASRCKYDMRNNNHLFGRVTPYFKTTTSAEAKSLYNKIIALAWRIGRSFVGSAEFSLVEPSGNAIEALRKELIIYMKHISINTKIPLQWLAYPELLSNRATADNMVEMINAGTLKERMIWQEAFTELIRKAMVMAYERGYINFNKPKDFIVEIPNVTISLLEQIASTWIPLAEAEYISKDTVRGKVPGIDPSKEKKLIDKEKDESMERFNNNMLGNNSIKTAIEENNKGESQESEEKTE
jgi:hypothetical protein